MKLNRWVVLALGVVTIQCLLLGINHLPGLGKPDIAENRVLAAMPAAPGAMAQLKDYREAMDAYVADNFPARTHLIAGMNFLRYRLGYSGTHRVVVGREGWLFYDDDNHLSQLRHSHPLAGADVNAWVTTFAARTEALKAQGIDYLVFTPSVKERVYPEKAPAWAHSADGAADADVLAAALRQAGLENIVVMREPLFRQRATGTAFYSPFDTHWTGAGAYIGYVNLLAALTRMGHPMEPLPLSAFTRIDKPVRSRPQDLAVMLGLANFVRQEFEQYHDPRQEAALRVQYLTARQDWTGDRIIDTGQLGKPVIQLVIDSFSNELLPFLYPHFSRLVMSHNQDGFFRADLTAAYNPDIVVVEVLESGLRHSMNPAMQPSPGLMAALAPRLGVPSAAPVAVTFVAAAPATAAIETSHSLLPTARLVGLDGSTADASPNLTYRCNLERLEFSGGSLDAGAMLAAGWFADVENGRVADQVTLVLQSPAASYSVSMPIREGRSDVAQHFNKPVLTRSGFDLSATTDGVAHGTYDVYLRQSYGADSLTCITRRLAVVTAAGVRVPSI